MSNRLTVKFHGFYIEVEFDGFEDKQYGNHWEVLSVRIDGCAAHELLPESVLTVIEEALHAAVNGLTEEDE